jgi:hypothetical protein
MMRRLAMIDMAKVNNVFEIKILNPNVKIYFLKKFQASSKFIIVCTER